MYEEFMPDPELVKTTCLGVLIYLRDLSADKKTGVHLIKKFSVHEVRYFLKDALYATEQHLLNDVSQRLRKLERSGYLEKGDPEKLREISLLDIPPGHKAPDGGGRGRPPAFYIMTPKGIKYSRTFADVYLNEAGEPLDRESITPFLKEAGLVKTEQGTRIIVATLTQEKAIAAIAAWMKKENKHVTFKGVERV